MKFTQPINITTRTNKKNVIYYNGPAVISNRSLHSLRSANKE